MLVSRENLKNIKSKAVELPAPSTFDLPVRILQFGTGVLLRGLPDYYVDKANKQGIFNGRILVVKSTSSNGTDEFKEQDNIYTLCIKGIEDGEQVVKYTLINAISNVLSASKDWQEILKAAENPDLDIVFSNTTEVGITLSNDSIEENPPSSFPGKLLSFLYHRFHHFDGDEQKGLVILPTELISDNATKLKKIIITLATQNQLSAAFIAWLTSANDFCNTLVDRIVPGKLTTQDKMEVENLLGYQDDLMIMAEPFSLWAIETDSERVKQKLSFAKADENIKLVPSINKFKEIKLRLLNGTHTLSTAIALWSGFETVTEAMNNKHFHQFVDNLMRLEIGPAIVNQHIEKDDTAQFSRRVIDRFSNPFLQHRWESIALNYTSKMSMRVIDLIHNWYAKNHVLPQHIALGFAAYLKFMNSQQQEQGFVQSINGKTITLQDEFAPLLHDYWIQEENVVKNVLSDDNLWGKNLTQYKGFAEAVQNFIQEINANGVLHTIEKLNASWEETY
ncbi:tagaturonate reductase [Sphingobacterium lactis]|uniref:Tagaturonate reductase n=1 Tax=Sphingobacterium lactis TaxID=797291 RepID=A0A1H6C5L3_9SPHI|nr:tagaturonate reductase [Sphingobacterium lactis]SEG68027.1 tagaturonate reductase [Sphingobacterium lactis]